MKALVASFASGVSFALGLGIGGMTQPAKIVNFLDFAGTWDPSLAFVMIGAIPVYFLCYRMALRRPSPLFATEFSVPKPKGVDSELLLGSAIFGVGWGLGGFCPGPALTSLGSGATSTLIFVAAMVGGMVLHKLTTSLRSGALPYTAAAVTDC